ncbi:MAG: alpha-hydroxy acid oxidase [Vulcanimicrobiota bacterium]
MEPVNLDDFQEIARQKLSQSAYDYYVSGAHDQVTLARNRAAFDEIRLFYRVMVDVSLRSARTTLLGQPLSLPVLAAPTAFHAMATPDGELATARACAKAGTSMILSTLSNYPMEEVAQAAGGQFWFQLYVYKDRQATHELVARARHAGARALVVTVDAPLLGCREADVRNRFALPEGLKVVNLTAAGLADLPATVNDSGLAAYFYSMIDDSLNWKDIEWLRSISDLPVFIKGVVRVDDARRAIESGASGLVVSNHGGRQLDTSPATIEVLGPIARAVAGRIPVLLDGGVRRGTDVVKALALGASAVLIGRPILWGLASAGEAGVTQVFELFRREIDLAMALCGTPTLADIGPDLLDPGQDLQA